MSEEKMTVAQLETAIEKIEVSPKSLENKTQEYIKQEALSITHNILKILDELSFPEYGSILLNRSYTYCIATTQYNDNSFLIEEIIDRVVEILDQKAFRMSYDLDEDEEHYELLVEWGTVNE